MEQKQGILIVAFIIAVLMVTVNDNEMVLRAGFFWKVIAVIMGTIVGYIGIIIGSSIKENILPHSIWPPIIGALLGVALGCVIVLKPSSQATKIRGEILAGCVHSSKSKSECKCIYDKIEDKFSTNDLIIINKAKQAPDDFIRLSRKTPSFRARMQSEGGIAAPLPFVG